MGRIFLLPLLFATLVINPAFLTACGEADPDFSYGEAEMLALLKTVGEAPWSHQMDHEAYTLEFHVQQGTEVHMSRATPPTILPTAWACANRDFVRGAAACIDASHLARQVPKPWWPKPPSGVC